MATYRGIIVVIAATLSVGMLFSPPVDAKPVKADDIYLPPKKQIYAFDIPIEPAGRQFFFGAANKNAELSENVSILKYPPVEYSNPDYQPRSIIDAFVRSVVHKINRLI